MEGGMIEAGKNSPMSSESVLDVEDLIKKSLKAGEGIASYKNQLPTNDSIYTHADISEDYQIDLDGVREINALMFESENLSAEELRRTIKNISENKIISG